jgi:hypothetical protein
MSEEENNAETEEAAFNVHDIFNKQEPQASIGKEQKAPAKEPVQKVAATPVEEEEESELKEDSAEKKSENKSIDYKAEFEKLQKSVKDTQRSFHEDRKKLSAYKQAVEKLKADGSILDEEAQMLLDHTKFEEGSSNQEKPLLHKWYDIWDKELPYLKKYANDPKEIDQQIFAIQHFVQTATKAELDDMIKELSVYEDDEAEFTKKMLEFGRQYNLDIYSDISEAGSIRNLKSKYAEKEIEYQKKLDKLQAKYDKLKEKYEDYNTEPATRLSSSGGGENLGLQKKVTFDPATIFESQYQRR